MLCLELCEGLWWFGGVFRGVGFVVCLGVCLSVGSGVGWGGRLVSGCRRRVVSRGLSRRCCVGVCDCGHFGGWLRVFGALMGVVAG